MSPPCQPFTRNGNFKDVDDRRSDAFMSVCEIIKQKQLPRLGYILMENVMGFEKSQMRDIFIDALSGFHYQEFIISPTQIGVANTRHRYYCIARKDRPFSFSSPEIVRMNFCVILSSILISYLLAYDVAKPSSTARSSSNLVLHRWQFWNQQQPPPAFWHSRKTLSSARHLHNRLD